MEISKRITNNESKYTAHTCGCQAELETLPIKGNDRNLTPNMPLSQPCQNCCLAGGKVRELRVRRNQLRTMRAARRGLIDVINREPLQSRDFCDVCSK